MYPIIVIGSPTFIQSFAVKVPVAKANIPCGELTGKIKPKLTTNCKSMVISITFKPAILRSFNTAIIIGIIDDATAVALANPKCTTSELPRLIEDGASCFNHYSLSTTLLH